MAGVDSDLLARFKLVKQTPFYIAVVLKGADAVFDVDKKKIPEKKIAALKKSSGGTAAFKGLIAREDDQYVVRVAKEAPGTADKALKKAIKEACGLNVNVAFVLDPSLADDLDGEDDAGESAPQGASAPEPELATQQPAPFDAMHFTSEMKRLVPEIGKMQDPAKAASSKQFATALVAAIKTQDAAAASAAIDGIEALLQDAGSGASAPEPPRDGEAMREALAEWQTQRGASINALKGVAGRIAAAKHASSTKAIIEIQAVIKNLTAEPKTLQQVTDLQTWLSKDQVVQDVCDLVEDVRAPLLTSLKRLQQHLAA